MKWLSNFHIPVIGNVNPFTGGISGQRAFTPANSNPYGNPSNVGVGHYGFSNQATNIPTPPGTINGGTIYGTKKV